MRWSRKRPKKPGPGQKPAVFGLLIAYENADLQGNKQATDMLPV